MCRGDTTLLSSQEVPWNNCFGIWRNITHKVFLNEFYPDNKYIMFLPHVILSLSHCVGFIHIYVMILVSHID